jgi:hypothetical protein
MGIDNVDGDKFKIINDWNFTSGAGVSDITINPSNRFIGFGIDAPTNKHHINVSGANSSFS